jgi:hypothetical protein
MGQLQHSFSCDLLREEPWEFPSTAMAKKRSIIIIGKREKRKTKIAIASSLRASITQASLPLRPADCKQEVVYLYIILV